MPKAYWIAHVTVTDPDRYPDYVKANKIAFENFGARFLVRGGAFEAPEAEVDAVHADDPHHRRHGDRLDEFRLSE